MLRTSIPKNVSVMEATFHHKPVMIFDPYAKSSLAYLKLADELIERNKVYAV
jgi:chromosome partitioning protein